MRIQTVFACIPAFLPQGIAPAEEPVELSAGFELALVGGISVKKGEQRTQRNW
jgi:hypothetical protein